jgi:excisionase family DNA binding protein
MDRIIKARSITSRPPVAQLAVASGGSQVLTLQQAATYLSISKAHLSNLIAARVPGVPPLHHARIGRRILIRQAWLDEWLDASAQL